MNDLLMSAAVWAAITSQNMCQEEIAAETKKQEKKKRQEEQAGRLLLLNGGTYFMDINTSETVKIMAVTRDNSKGIWLTKFNGEELQDKFFSSIFHKVLELSEAKGVQVIPYSVTPSGIVDAYWIMIKIPLKETKIQESLQSVADKMSEDLKTAW